MIRKIITPVLAMALGGLLSFAIFQIKEKRTEGDKVREEIIQTVSEGLKDLHSKEKPAVAEPSMSDQIKQIVDSYERMVDRYEVALKEMDKQSKLSTQQSMKLGALVYDLMRQSGKTEMELNQKMPEHAQVQIQYLDGESGDRVKVKISEQRSIPWPAGLELKKQEHGPLPPNLELKRE